MRILVDLDGIVANTLPKWLERIALRTGITANIQDIIFYDLSICPKLQNTTSQTILSVLQEPDFTLNIEPIEGAIDALQYLINSGHEVYIVTARTGTQHIIETFGWLKIHAPFIDTSKNLVFLHDKHLLAADVIVDDRSDTLSKYAETHPNSLVTGLRCPYNSAHWPVLHDSWPEILAAICSHGLTKFPK